MLLATNYAQNYASIIGKGLLLVLCTEVTYGKGSLLTERNLDMSTKTTFKFIFIMVVVYNKRSN